MKTQKTGPGLAVIAIPKPVFSGFTVFFLVSALKARKLPDLSGRQIRHSIWSRRVIRKCENTKPCPVCGSLDHPCMAEIGPRSGIEKQLDSLKKQKDTQSKELSISEEDISKYDTAISELTKLKAQLQIIDNDISIINSIDSVVVPVEPDDALSDDAQKDYSDAISTIKNKADELWKEYKLAIIKKCQHGRLFGVHTIPHSDNGIQIVIVGLIPFPVRRSCFHFGNN